MILLDGSDIGSRPERGDEPGQLAFTANAVEETDALRLGAKRHLTARGVFKGQRHQMSTNAPTLVRRVDENFRYGGKEVAVGQDSNAADEARPVPCADVDGALQRGGGLGGRIVAWPHALREREEVIGADLFAV